MSWDENHVDPSNIHSTNVERHPIPPPTPPREVVLKNGCAGIIRNAVRIDPLDKTLPVLGREGQDSQNEHAYLCRTLCKTTKYSRSFDGIQFSRMEFYERSLIRVLTIRPAEGHLAQVPNRRREDSHPNPNGIIGFSNFLHKKRSAFSKVYFFVTDPEYYRLGVGELLNEDFERSSPHPTLELEVEFDNPNGLAFWKRMGYEIIHDRGIPSKKNGVVVYKGYYLTKCNPYYQEPTQ